ncbi:MAG: hypothetical protein VKK42_26010 [Lyngbya sp.]|nr:hypothetical protein [Lyngbya sp.]
MLPTQEIESTTVKKEAIESFLIILEQANSRQVIYSTDSEVECQQFLWLASMVAEYGLDTLEDALRTHLDSRYYDV